jgi:hypothetical protein
MFRHGLEVEPGAGGSVSDESRSGKEFLPFVEGTVAADDTGIRHKNKNFFVRSNFFPHLTLVKDVDGEKGKLCGNAISARTKETMVMLGAKYYRLFLLGAASLSLLLPSMAFGQTSTITCHCFQDRSFDPNRPDAADAYFLATAQNTLLSVAFERPKREVVMAKQGGTSNEDLWISYRAAANSGIAPRSLLNEKRRAGHWQPVLRQLHIDLGLPDNLASSGWDEVLARAVFDQVLLELSFADRETLETLRKAGGSQQETLLAALLAQAGTRTALDYYRQVRFENHPWGQLLADHGLAENLGEIVRERAQKADN